MSSFRGNNIFGSGPHRFTAPARELLVIPLWVIQGAGFDDGQGSAVLGDKEIVVEVAGRLVAPSEAGLWTLRQAAGGEATLPQKEGVLVDNDGRSYAAMTMVRYEESGPIDRGRLWSVRYRAVFRNVKN